MRHDETETWLYPLKVFTVLKRIQFRVRPTPILEFLSGVQVDQEGAKTIVKESRLYTKLEDMRKQTFKNSTRSNTRAHQTYNARPMDY